MPKSRSWLADHESRGGVWVKQLPIYAINVTAKNVISEKVVKDFKTRAESAQSKRARIVIACVSDGRASLTICTVFTPKPLSGLIISLP